MEKFTVRLHVGPAWSKDYVVNAIDYQDAAKKAKAHAAQFDGVDVNMIHKTSVKLVTDDNDALTFLPNVSY